MHGSVRQTGAIARVGCVSCFGNPVFGWFSRETNQKNPALVGFPGKPEGYQPSFGGYTMWTSPVVAHAESPVQALTRAWTPDLHAI